MAHREAASRAATPHGCRAGAAPAWRSGSPSRPRLFIARSPRATSPCHTCATGSRRWGARRIARPMNASAQRRAANSSPCASR